MHRSLCLANYERCIQAFAEKNMNIAYKSLLSKISALHTNLCWAKHAHCIQAFAEKNMNTAYVLRSKAWTLHRSLCWEKYEHCIQACAEKKYLNTAYKILLRKKLNNTYKSLLSKIWTLHTQQSLFGKSMNTTYTTVFAEQILNNIHIQVFCWARHEHSTHFWLSLFFCCYCCFCFVLLLLLFSVWNVRA